MTIGLDWYGVVKLSSEVERKSTDLYIAVTFFVKFKPKGKNKKVAEQKVSAIGYAAEEIVKLVDEGKLKIGTKFRACGFIDTYEYTDTKGEDHVGKSYKITGTDLFDDLSKVESVEF